MRYRYSRNQPVQDFGPKDAKSILSSNSLTALTHKSHSIGIGSGISRHQKKIPPKFKASGTDKRYMGKNCSCTGCRFPA